MTCRPPPGTKPGTLCILTRGAWQCVGEWEGGTYTFRRPSWNGQHGMFADAHAPDERASGCRCGWVFAGVMPEMPPRPQTAQEIAREALGRSYPSNVACISGLKMTLERIRDMPEEV